MKKTLFGLLLSLVLTVPSYAVTYPKWVGIQEKPILDVKEFGAKGDGSTDDTSSILAAMAAAASSSKPLFFPVGSYNISQPLPLSSGMRILGCGADKSLLVQTVATATFYFSGSSIEKIELTDFCICSGTNALRFEVTTTESKLIAKRMKFSFQSSYSIYCNREFLVNDLNDCVFWYSGGGVFCGAHANLNNFVQCKFEGVSGPAFSFCNTLDHGGQTNNIFGCRFEAISGAGPVILASSCYELAITHNYFEDVPETILRVEGGYNNSFEGNFLTSPPAPAKIYITNSTLFNFSNNMFNAGGVLYASASTFNTLSCSSNVNIIGNLQQETNIQAADVKTSLIARLELEDDTWTHVATFTKDANSSSGIDYLNAMVGTIYLDSLGTNASGSWFSSRRSYDLSISGIGTYPLELVVESLGHDVASCGTVIPDVYFRAVGVSSITAELQMKATFAQFNYMTSVVSLELTSLSRNLSRIQVR